MTQSISHPPVVIPYRSQDFKIIPNGAFTLEAWPEELLWAAITVGRANFLDVLAHGQYSEYELIYRISMILANLKRTQQNHLEKSPAFLHLDPSEKGAISYFLGMSVCKLFADRLLNAPWLLHFDVYRAWLDISQHIGTRKKPDLIGWDYAGNWVVLESKGRTNGFSPDLLVKGKDQAQSIDSINGLRPLQIAAVTHFAEGFLGFDWTDPEEFNEDGLNLWITPENFLSIYYKQIYNILFNNIENTFVSRQFRFYRFEHLGLTIGLHEDIYIAYQKQLLSKINRAENQRFQKIPEIEGQLFYFGPDGIAIGISQEIRDQLR